MSWNYYNEKDRVAAAWLRELIKQGHIAPGVVDERSIVDVRPGDLAGFTQCHFFAGIGVWSYALRLAGWPDSRPIWTGSCPCQPFSNAGGRAGFDDERHLWPAWFQLIAQCRPPEVLGEQVASKDGLEWLDLVSLDMEAAGYAFGAADLCAAGVGAPHIRQRLWFVGALADDDDDDDDRQRARAERELYDREHHAEPRSSIDGLADAQRHSDRGEINAAGHGQPETDGPADRAGGCGGAPRGLADAHRDHGAGRFDQPHGRATFEPDRRGSAGGPGHADDGRSGWNARAVPGAQGSVAGSVRGQPDGTESAGPAGDLADAQREGLQARAAGDVRGALGHDEGRLAGESGERRVRATDSLGTHWSDADWIYCRDDRYRPVEPGTQPLAHGSPARVGRLRGYGNCIVAQVAQTFIESYLDGERQ